MVFCPETVSKLSQFGLPRFWQLITPCSDLRSGWGLKKTCSFPWELSNGALHSACTHRCRVDSQLSVVGSQSVNSIIGPSFAHTLCWICLNGPCEAIFDIYASRPFQRYKEHLKARCFDPCNRGLNFRKSRRTPKSPFQECECHSHTLSKWGCDTLTKHYKVFTMVFTIIFTFYFFKAFYSHMTTSTSFDNN
jgi:hypothetical protein